MRPVRCNVASGVFESTLSGGTVPRLKLALAIPSSSSRRFHDTPDIHMSTDREHRTHAVQPGLDLRGTFDACPRSLQLTDRTTGGTC